MRPASTAIARTFASVATRNVSVPITGTSKRMSWFGFVTLITIAFFLPNEPPRLIASFVPSKASTARTVPFFTTTVWPTSSGAELFRDLETEGDVFLFALLQFRPGDVAVRREQMIEKGGGRQKLDLDLRELVGDRPEDRFGVAFFQPGEKEHRFKIRTQTEKVAGRNLPGHDRFSARSRRGKK